MVSAAKIESAERGLNGMARKVLDAVPRQERWTLTQIVAECGRLGYSTDFRVIQGCISALVEQRLVRAADGCYQRIAGKTITLRQVEPDEAPAPAAPAPQLSAPPANANSHEDTLARIAGLASDLRVLSGALSDTASRLDDLGIEIVQRLEQISGDSQKLRSLQSILKSIGV